MTARNRAAFERARRNRLQIRRVWLELIEHSPFERHMAKDIARRLDFKLAPSTLHWHMQQIRLEDQARRCNGSNVSVESDRAPSCERRDTLSRSSAE